MLSVHHSNSLDRLADALAHTITTAPLAPMTPEIIVVPATGLARWLTTALTERIGIVANTRFVLPASYSWTLIRSVLADVPERSPLAPEVLQWRIARLLGQLPSTPAYAPVRRYLGEGGAARRLDLARELAALIDRYAIERPGWIEAWIDGKRVAELEPFAAYQAWQAGLLRSIARESPNLPHVHPRERFFRALDGDIVAQSCLPGRVSVFGVGALPQLYLDFFAQLGRHVEVTVYVPNPCREYWGQIDRHRRVERAALAGERLAAYLESGNRLFASLAQQGRAFFDELVKLDSPGDQLFVEPSRPSLLAAIQRDILDLVEPTEKLALSVDDASIRIANCHSSVREAEVLHDYLLSRFEADPTLRCEDILILTPDIDHYGGAIDAVFGAVTGPTRIPVAIRDRAPLASVPIVQSFNALLDVAKGRLEASPVLDLLEIDAIARRFRIEPSGLRQLRDWVDKLGIRWARDEAHRSQLELPPERAATWEAGLDRLLLGSALGADEMFGGVVPLAEVEGADAELIGRFGDFTARVFALADATRRRHGVSAWVRLWLDALSDFFAPGAEDELALARVRQALIGMSVDAQLAQFDEALPIAAAATMLQAELARAVGTGRASSAGVAVCDLAGEQVVDARIVCVLGLNDDTFPRRDPKRGFDLIDRAPRAGDLRRRDADRYAFLRALVAARETLYLSYSGRDQHHDSERPPSVILAELFDAIRRRAAGSDGSDPVEALTTRHPLQPFSARYGRDDERGAALRTFAQPWQPVDVLPVSAFVAHGLELPADDEANVVRVESLIRFFRNPARHFLQERLGVGLLRAESQIAEHEPFELDGLAGFRVRQAMLEARAASVEAVAAMRPRFQAQALLPVGAIGEAALAHELGKTTPLLREIERLAHSEPSTRDVEFDIGKIRLTGVIREIYPQGRLSARPGRLRAIDLLDGWIWHLVLNACEPTPAPSITFGLEKDVLRTHRWRGLTPDEATGALADLLALYEQGSRSVLPFYPESSYAWAKEPASPNAKKSALERAKAAWGGNEFQSEKQRPESADPYFALAARDRAEIFDASFDNVARHVYGPLLAASE